MKGMILAAGEGTRLRSKTKDIPKPLIKVNGKEILTYCFETFIEVGISEVVVVVGYKKEQIKNRYGDRFRELSIQYAYQAEQKGLAHAVLTAKDYIESDFVVLNGDNIYSGNLTTAVEHHTKTEVDITFLIDEVSLETAKQGAVCKLDADGNITGLVEKPNTPPSKYAPTAFYILPPEIFDACRLVKPSGRGEYELPDAIDLLIRAGYDVETVPFEGWKVNINTEDDIQQAEQKLSEQAKR